MDNTNTPTPPTPIPDRAGHMKSVDVIPLYQLTEEQKLERRKTHAAEIAAVAELVPAHLKEAAGLAPHRTDRNAAKGGPLNTEK